MEEIQLKDICDLDNGYAFKSDDYVESSGTLNCRMSNIRPDGSFDILYSAKYLPDEFAEKYKDYILNDGDLIIAMTDMAGDPKILGVPTVVDTKGYTLLLNQRVGKLRFIKSGINADYLKLALQSKRVREYLKRFAGGGVQLNVSKKDILNAPVRMRTVEEQDYIANLFHRVQMIMKQREQELLYLDELIKARFVELFGDVKENPKNYPVVHIKEVISSCEAGWSGNGTQREKQDGEIAVLKVSAVTKGYFIPDECKVLDDQENIKKRVIPEKGDLIFSRANTREMVGATAIVMQDYPELILSDKLWKIRFSNNADVCYMKHVLSSKHIRDQFSAQSTGTSGSMFNVSMEKFFGISIPLPPVEEQIEFKCFVEQVDKSKVAVQRALEETQTLFDSLMQEYFG